MADLAHDASGPASSEPAGTAQQPSGPATSDKGKLRVFISYSRDDQKFADQLDEALNVCGLGAASRRITLRRGKVAARLVGFRPAAAERSRSAKKAARTRGSRAS